MKIIEDGRPTPIDGEIKNCKWEHRLSFTENFSDC